MIIEPDGDWRGAAAKLKIAGFSHAGQSCISAQRLLVHRSIHDEFVAALSDEVETLVVGPPLDEATDVSALISSGDTERVKGWIDDAVAAGAKVRSAATWATTGCQPTVLTDVTPDMKVCATGCSARWSGWRPTTISTRRSRWPTTPLRAAGAIFTARIDAALAAARRLDFGGVMINEVPTWRADQQPYGGLRDSGNTREGPRYAVREMTEHRLIVIQP